MSNQPLHEPRLERAKKKIKPQPAWVGVYESYEPLEQPWPFDALAIILYGQGVIWAHGGNVNHSVLCQIMAQTDTGVEIDVDYNIDVVWDTLVASLSELPWGKKNGEAKQQAFFAAASMLSDAMRKNDITRRASEQSEIVANDMLQEVYGQQPVPADEDQEPMMMDGADEALEELRQQLQEPAEES